jgi:hypothetical protein
MPVINYPPPPRYYATYGVLGWRILYQIQKRNYLIYFTILRYDSIFSSAHPP